METKIQSDFNEVTHREEGESLLMIGFHEESVTEEAVVDTGVRRLCWRRVWRRVLRRDDC